MSNDLDTEEALPAMFFYALNLWFFGLDSSFILE